MDLQGKRYSLISAMSVRLVDSHLCTVQHGSAVRRLGIILIQRAEKADVDRLQVFQVGGRNASCRAVVLKGVRLNVPFLIRLAKASIGNCLLRHVGITQFTLRCLLYVLGETPLLPSGGYQKAE